MKTLMTVVFTVLALNLSAQRVEIEPGALLVHAKTITVAQAFKLTDDLVYGVDKLLDRYVIKDGVTYYRPGIAMFRKPRIYIVNKDGSLTKMKNEQIGDTKRADR